jgi:chromosome segregation ATPase
MRKRIVSVMMIFFIGLWLAGCKTVRSVVRKSQLRTEELKELNSRKSELESQIKHIDQMLPEIDAEIVKHEENIEKMKARIRKGRETGKKPDISGIEVYADAAGGRTEAYHKAPAWKKDAINKLEGMHVFNAWDGSRLANAAIDGNVEEIFLDNEINRSKRMRKILQVSRKRWEEARTKADDELQRINKELAQSSTTIDDEESNGDGGNGGGD